MEIAKWLEPSIIQRIDEVSEAADKKFKPTEDQFHEVFQKLKKRHPESIKELLILDSLFARRSDLVEFAYRIGFEDGSALRMSFKQ